MDKDIFKRIENLEHKVDAIYISVEKTRKYLKWTLIITVIIFVLPLIGLMLAVPMFLTSYLSTMEGII